MVVQERPAQPQAAETQELLTGEELAAMGDIGPSELIAGRLVPVSPTQPRHGEIEFTIAYYLGAFVRERKLGRVQVGEVGLYTHRNPDTVRAADVLFISNERSAKASPAGFLDVAPELIVEILSPDDRWFQVRKKLREYFEIGVNVVLVVDPEERTISAYRSLTNIQVFGEADLLVIEDILPGFSAPVAEVFAA